MLGWGRAGRLAFAVATAPLACEEAALAGVNPPIAWDAPPGCPDEGHVLAAIARWLDLPRTHLDAGSVRIEATVRPRDAGWELDLTLTSPGGSERETLVAGNCEALVEVVALKVALAADPMSLVPSLASSASRAQAHTGSISPAFALRGTVGTGLGAEPAPSEFLGLTGSVDLPWWRAEIGAAAWRATAARYSQLPGVGADISLSTASARFCLLPLMGGVDLPICAGAAICLMRGAGFGVPATEVSNQLWVATVLGPAVRYRLGPSFAAWVGVDAVIAIDRPGFHMRNLDLLYRPDSVSAQAWAGLEFRP
jgi:hypothetical protein